LSTIYTIGYPLQRMADGRIKDCVSQIHSSKNNNVMLTETNGIDLEGLMFISLKSFLSFLLMVDDFFLIIFLPLF